MKNYIKRASMLLKSENDPEKQVFNASRKAENKLTQVISQLLSDIVDAEIALDEAKRKYEDAKYSIDWLTNPSGTLKAIDAYEAEVEALQDKLEDLKYTLEKREKLQAEYKQEIEK